MKDIRKSLIHCRSIWVLKLYMERLDDHSSRSPVDSAHSSVSTVDSKVMMPRAEIRGLSWSTVKVL
jgi:hypothetical protein